MSIEKRLFLGIKQMTKTAFLELEDSEKVGYIWFVRCEDPVHFEIYLGTKKYGETNETVEQFIREIAEKLRTAIGLNEELTLPEDFQYQDLIAALNDHGVRISEIEEKIVGLFKFKGVFDTLTELFASGETVDGYVYQVVYRDIEQNEEGEWVPVIPPTLVNSEFVWGGDEWVELGPLFDNRELKEIFDITSEHQECLESMNVISDEFIHSLFLGGLRQLVIDVIGGEVLSKTGEGGYRPGTVVRIGVEPEDGYSFIEWNDGNTNQYRRVVVKDSETGNTYVALLATEEQTGTIIPLVLPGQEEMGHVEGGGTGVIGEYIPIEAFRNGKTEFIHWLNKNGDIVSVDNPYSVEIISTGITNFYAEFQQIGFDTIINNLNDVPYNSNYRVGWSDEMSGVSYSINGTHRMYDNEFTSAGQINNKRGWKDDLDPVTHETIHYENLIYPGNGEKNIVFVLCANKSNNWSTYQRNGVIMVSGEDGLDSVRFNYGYSYNDGDVTTGKIPNAHLLVKIYTGTEENNDNLVAVFKIQRTFEDWGYKDEEEKILQRPFVFDSVSEYDCKNEQICGKLDIRGEYLVTIRNYFSKTDLIKNPDILPEEYYGDDTFDDTVKIDNDGRIIVRPMVRLAVDNIEVGLTEEERQADAGGNKKEIKKRR
jgi:hypothetical protein